MAEIIRCHVVHLAGSQWVAAGSGYWKSELSGYPWLSTSPWLSCLSGGRGQVGNVFLSMSKVGHRSWVIPL